MKLELHPKAIANYDERAARLVTSLAPDPWEAQIKARWAQPSVDPGIYAEALPEGAVTKFEIGDSYMDGYGREVAKYFNDETRNIGLFDDGYKNLIKLAEEIQNNKTLRDLVSKNLVKDLIFDWIRDNHKQRSSSSMTEYVLTECGKQIKEFEIWIPVSKLLLFGTNIRVGRVTFKSVTKEMLDAYLGDTPEMTAEVRVGAKRIRSELQGYAAAAIKVVAEPQRANEIAYDEADKALSLLRFYSPVNSDPTRVSYAAILGEQHEDSFHRLVVENGKIINYHCGLLDKGSPYWQLDQSYVEDLTGLDILSALLSRKDRTDFQEKLLAALLQYSRNCLARDPSDKLVNILVALESVILQNENEPLGKNVGERMAALIGSTVDDRKRILVNVAKTYRLRSSFVHHGKRISLDELETLKEFMMNAWRCLGSLVDLYYKNPAITRSGFFAELEERRLSY
jgi:hypothetical protein